MTRDSTILKQRILTGEGKFSQSEIPSVIGNGVQTDAAKINLFQKIQKCVVERVYGTTSSRSRKPPSTLMTPQFFDSLPSSSTKIVRPLTGDDIRVLLYIFENVHGIGSMEAAKALGYRNQFLDYYTDALSDAGYVTRYQSTDNDPYLEITPLGRQYIIEHGYAKR